MIVSIHQPNFLPYLGFFDKVKKSDLVVWLDDSQFQKNVFLNRNKIRTAAGATWFTLPVNGSIHKKINEVTISQTTNWKERHLGILAQSYKKAANFERVYQEFQSLYNKKDWEMMADLNLALIEWLMSSLGLQGKQTVLSSSLGCPGKSSALLLEIVKKVGGTIYLSGSMGREYLDEKNFRENGIEVQYHDFQAFEYPQCFPGPFLPNLSALDYILNVENPQI